MKIITRQSDIQLYDHYEQINDSFVQDLCEASKMAMELSYSPYSEYRVGAAVALKDGQIIKGANQENAVYPLGLCAERVALFTVSTQYPGAVIQSLAVCTSKKLTSDQLPPFPCGSCRQVIKEFEDRQQSDIAIYVVGSNNATCVMSSIKNILPFAFGQDSL